MTAYSDGYWTSGDGVRLHYRDYPARAPSKPDRPPLICLHGLTRNARDFAKLAERFSDEWRVLCLDMRGRGGSAAAPDPLTYGPLQYCRDVLALLDQQAIPSFIAVGTSLGGLMTMALALDHLERIAGAVLNDIGPVLESAGLEHIFSYLGLDQRYQDWNEAAAALSIQFAKGFPDRDFAGWVAFAQRVMVPAEDGTLRFDYDPRIAVPFGQPAEPLPDLWPGLEALAAKPLLLIRGGLSELLSPASFAEMQARAPGCLAVTVPRVGHAPELDEPEALAGIAELLERLA